MKRVFQTNYAGALGCGKGNDTINGGAGNNYIGNDTLLSGEDADIVNEFAKRKRWCIREAANNAGYAAQPGWRVAA